MNPQFEFEWHRADSADSMTPNVHPVIHRNYVLMVRHYITTSRSCDGYWGAWTPVPIREGDY